VTGALAALDDDLDMIQQQLEHQMQAQDQNQDDARYGSTHVARQIVQLREPTAGQVTGWCMCLLPAQHWLNSLHQSLLCITIL
jgi:hypothetical protein